MSRCPACNQIIKVSRICHKCKNPIGKSHKWKQIELEDYSYKLEHWDCKNPDSYGDKYEKEKKK